MSTMTYVQAAARAITAAGMAAALTGCANINNLYAPTSTYNVDQDIADMHDHYGTVLSIKAYYAVLPETVERRNEFIAGRISLANLEYIRFTSQFTLTKAQEESIFDLTATGLGLATTITGGANTKTILGAVTTALTGVRTTFDKNFFNQQTAPALISQMNALRKTALVPLLQGMHASVADYPLSTAIIDLDNYQAAGTIEGALQSIQSDAAATDAKAQKQIDSYRTFAFSPDAATDKLKAWLWPGFKSFSRDGVALDAAGAVIAADTQHLSAFEAYLKSKQLDGVPLFVILNNGALASTRADAVSALKIP